MGAYRAVIVDDGSALSERAISELAAYVRAGGGLLCAGSLGTSLAQLAGVTLDGEVSSGRPEHPLYYRFDTDAPEWGELHGRLLSTSAR